MINRLASPTSQQAADGGSGASRVLCNERHEQKIGLSVLVHWHLLSLDAPFVAVLWTVFTASVTHTKLPIATPIAMALTVWMLYASDRLLDTRHLGSIHRADKLDDLEPRHLFHHQYRAAFLIAIVICAITLSALLPLLPQAAIRLYLTEGALMAGYFLLIHAAPQQTINSWVSVFFSTYCIPKELLVGPFFAAAIFIPTVSRRPELRLGLLPLAILFAALCSLNCLYIYAWEHRENHRSSTATAYSVRNLDYLTWLFLTISLLCFIFSAFIAHASFSFQLYPIACATSAFILLTIHKHRERLTPLAIRAAADAALLTPLALLPFFVWHLKA